MYRSTGVGRRPSIGPPNGITANAASAEQRDDRPGDQVEDAVGAVRGHRLLEEQLDAVGQRLQQARTGRPGSGP